MSDRASSARQIFISHSSENNAFGVQLTQDLRRVLGDDNAVWYDVHGGLHGGDIWWPKIIEEITSRPVFIVILSSHAMASPWVQAEINLAWRQMLSPRKKHIIPILYETCEVRPDLDTLQIISFLPPKSYDTSFNELLLALGLPTHDFSPSKEKASSSPDLTSTIFQQMEKAFAEQDWSTVLRKADYLLKHTQHTLSPEVYRMQGVAFSKHGEIEAAQEALDTAIALADNDQQCLLLFSDCTSMFASLGRWEDVLRYTTQAIRLAPDDPNWQSGHQQAQMMVHSSSPTPSTPKKQRSGKDKDIEPPSMSKNPGPPDNSSSSPGFSSINDLFETFFGDKGNKANSEKSLRGADLRYEMTITFEEAVFGCQKEIELPRWETCSNCRGTGAQPGTSTTPCKKCRGQGRGRVNRRVVVNIPAGVDDGINVRVTGEGEVSAHGGTPGNLYIVLTVKPHPFFKRQGSDVIYELLISAALAAQGGQVEVPTIDGKSTILKIPAGTPNGHIFQLKGMGAPKIHSSTRGDQHIIINFDESKATTGASA